jgi:hypothetical protein
VAASTIWVQSVGMVTRGAATAVSVGSAGSVGSAVGGVVSPGVSVGVGTVTVAVGPAVTSSPPAPPAHPVSPISVAATKAAAPSTELRRRVMSFPCLPCTRRCGCLRSR